MQINHNSDNTKWKEVTQRSGVSHCDAKVATDVVHRCESGIYLLDPSSSAAWISGLICYRKQTLHRQHSGVIPQ